MREEMARGAYIAGVNAGGIGHFTGRKDSHGPLEVEITEADKERSVIPSRTSDLTDPVKACSFAVLVSNNILAMCCL